MLYFALSLRAPQRRLAKILPLLYRDTTLGWYFISSTCAKLHHGREAHFHDAEKEIVPVHFRQKRFEIELSVFTLRMIYSHITISSLMCFDVKIGMHCRSGFAFQRWPSDYTWMKWAPLLFLKRIIYLTSISL
jgi:hypothetical protein